MLEPSNMYPESFHPVVTDRSRDYRGRAKAYSRTWRPTRYLLIDFGHARQYDTSKGPPVDEPLSGGDKSAPEHQIAALCNPFPTDVYYLGNMVREDYLQVGVQPFSPSPRKFILTRARNAMVSSLWNHSSPTWSKKTLRNAQPWTRSLLVFRISGKTSAHGSYGRGWSARTRSGLSVYGELSATGLVPSVTSSLEERLFLNPVERPMMLNVLLLSVTFCCYVLAFLCGDLYIPTV